jgi:hypothetical protein
MDNNSENIQQVIRDLNGNYADIFRNIVEGTRLFRSMTLSDDHNVENSIAASLIESGWLDQNDQNDQNDQEKNHLLIDEAEYIVTSLSHERTLLNYLNPSRITPEMRTSIFRVITNIMNWIQNHSTDENNSRSSSHSSSINSQSDQGSYSGEEPDIEDVLRIGESDSEASGFDTPLQSDDDDVDSESTDIDERLPYNAQGGKSKKARKSKNARKSNMTHKSKKTNRLKGGKSKMARKSKNANKLKRSKSKMARKSKKNHK